MRRGASLRVRLTLWNALVVAASLFFCGLAIHFAMHRHALRQVDADLLNDGPMRSSIILKLADLQEKGVLKDVDLELGSYVSWRVLDHTGRPAFYDMLGLENVEAYDIPSFQAAVQGTPDYRTIEHDRVEHRLLSYPVRQEGVVRYVVQSAAPLAPYFAATREVDRILGDLVPVALALAVLGGMFLTGRGLRPIGRMVATAETIHAGNLDRRLPAEGHDEVARMGQVFNQMLERLQGSFEQQRRLIADASHELRTPLAAIKANTSLALSQAPSLEGHQTALESVDRTADRMTRLINDLLFLARAEAGQLDPTLESIDLNALCRAVAEDFRLQAERAGVRIETDAVATRSARGDLEFLERILGNLLSNALRHTPAGRAVVVSTRDEGDGVVLEVFNPGAGIDAAHLPHLFDRFYQVDPSRSRSGSGTGLGLSIGKSLVEGMGGTISVRSEKNLGTTFEVRLIPSDPA